MTEQLKNLQIVKSTKISIKLNSISLADWQVHQNYSLKLPNSFNNTNAVKQFDFYFTFLQERKEILNRFLGVFLHLTQIPNAFI